MPIRQCVFVEFLSFKRLRRTFGSSTRATGHMLLCTNMYQKSVYLYLTTVNKHLKHFKSI
jgi:hypothetical protein